MSKKQSYLITAELWKSIRVMDIQDRGIVITAICELVFDGSVQIKASQDYKQQILDEILANVEQSVTRKLDISRKRSKAGTIGMSKRWKKQGEQEGITIVTETITKNNKCYDLLSEQITNDNNCYEKDNKSITSVIKTITNDNNCYPSRARFHHQQQNNYLEDIDNNNYINNNLDNNNYLEDNNYLDNNNEETNLREKIEGWLTDSCVRMEQLCKNNGLIDSPKTNDELVEILQPYIYVFVNHILASKPTEHIDRADTINHFANWMRIQKKQQDDGTHKLHIPTDEEYNEPF